MNRARLRLGRHSRIGQSYILTIVTQGRRHYFDDATAAQVVMEVIRRLDADGLTHSLAYVVMPDHVHWLVELRAFSLDYVMQRFKSSSALRTNRMLGRSGRFWQSSYHDHAIRPMNRCSGTRCTSSPTRSGRTWRAVLGSTRMRGADGRLMGSSMQRNSLDRRDSADQRSAPTSSHADQRSAPTNRCFPAGVAAQRFCANSQSHIAGSA